MARLVAEGRSDEEICEDLAITRVEAEAELAALMGKLGLRSRSEVALLLGSAAWRGDGQRP